MHFVGSIRLALDCKEMVLIQKKRNKRKHYFFFFSSSHCTIFVQYSYRDNFIPFYVCSVLISYHVTAIAAIHINFLIQNKYNIKRQDEIYLCQAFIKSRLQFHSPVTRKRHIHVTDEPFF